MNNNNTNTQPPLPLPVHPPGWGMILDGPAGAQTRIAELGTVSPGLTVVSIIPERRNGDGSWADPVLERRPLTFGGHRASDVVALEEAPPPEGAAHFKLQDQRWYRATVLCWYREAGGALQLAERHEIVTAW